MGGVLVFGLIVTSVCGFFMVMCFFSRRGQKDQFQVLVSTRCNAFEKIIKSSFIKKLVFIKEKIKSDN